MGRMTVYCVQPFWDDGRKLARGEVVQCTRRRDALRKGRAVANRNAGAMVLKVVADLDLDVCSEVRLLATFGEVPRYYEG